MEFLQGFEVTVQRPGGFDRHGNAKDAAPHTISRCIRDRKETIEVVDGVQVVTTTDLLLCDDPTADVQPLDTLTLPGDAIPWQVVGDVDRPDSPFTGWQPGCVIRIQRAAGAGQPQE